MSSYVQEILAAATCQGLASERREHLGASSIGAPCARAIWYDFRWAKERQFSGRMLRLFDRGHKEEERFTRWLRMAGYEVRANAKRLLCVDDVYQLVDWDNPDFSPYDDVSDDPLHIERATQWGTPAPQWSFADGHFKGSADGKVRGPGLPDDWGLLECKTSKQEAFKPLVKNGVRKEKPQHYTQMQVYMHYLDLPYALYLVVNKNDDDIYAEVVQYDEVSALMAVNRAHEIIAAQDTPPRVSTDPTWYICKMCDYADICHHNGAPEKNCRSCAFAAPETSWHCNKYKQDIPRVFIKTGCDNWETIE